ncbi:MAG: HlyD family efflux transporter periplasmic adaptor subunit [Acidobacteriia bacterium]|nr:HlyD family efflux transporter periplasmic adaptor subunit [Terriglobia bacterium]
MDKARVGYARRKRIRRIVLGSVAGTAFLAVAWVVSRIEPAAPGVDAATVFTDTVERGEMLRQVRGIGTLVPETVVVIAASDAGRIERRRVQPGQSVAPGTVLLELSSPQVEQEYLDAEAQLREAEADLANLRAQLEDQRLTQESVTADVEGQYLQAKAQYEADLALSKEGLTDQVTLMKSRVSMEHLRKQLQLERARGDARKPSVEAQLAAQRARIAQMEALVALRKEKVDRLRVRAGMNGVLQLMDVEVGQLVAPGDELARVSDPTHLKAELKIPETLVNDVAVGQRAEVDTRNGVIEGVVSRIDPAAIEGTVLVDIRLLGEMPRGARPDLSVDGTIELERLENVLHVGRPIHAREESLMGLFKLEEDQTHASRVQVQVGKVSVSTIEVRSGLSEGNNVVLSDMSAWDAYDRIRLE